MFWPIYSACRIHTYRMQHLQYFATLSRLILSAFHLQSVALDVKGMLIDRDGTQQGNRRLRKA